MSNLDEASIRPNKVTLFSTCMVEQLTPEVGRSAIEVLELLGVDVEYVDDQTCCGQPAFNSGFRSEAHPVAARFVDLFEKTTGPIVVPSGSCAAMVRNYYQHLFRDEPEIKTRAEAVSERLYEFTEFVVEFFGTSALKGQTALSNTAAYHKCCHLLREIKIDEEPIEMLNNVEGLDMVPLERADVCCGFGGSFSVKMADISTAVLHEKLDYIEKSGADTVVAADTGCVLQMQGGLRRRASSVRVVHIAEFLAESAQNARAGKQL